MATTAKAAALGCAGDRPRREDHSVYRRRQLVVVAAGGAVGAMARIALLQLWPVGSGLPWPTLLINIAGAFVLGLVAAATVSDAPLEAWRLPLIGTGFCGAFTTFSGMCLESLDLFDAGHSGVAVAYLSLSLVLGLGAAIAGVRLGSQPEGSQ